MIKESLKQLILKRVSLIFPGYINSKVDFNMQHFGELLKNLIKL